MLDKKVIANTLITEGFTEGSITGRCSGKEPALLPRTHGWTHEDSFVSLSQSVNRPQIFVGHKLSLSRIAGL